MVFTSALKPCACNVRPCIILHAFGHKYMHSYLGVAVTCIYVHVVLWIRPAYHHIYGCQAKCACDIRLQCYAQPQIARSLKLSFDPAEPASKSLSSAGLGAMRKNKL